MEPHPTPDATLKGQQDETNSVLEELTREYKEAKIWAAANALPELTSFEIVTEWLNSVYTTPDRDITEGDSTPADSASITSTEYYGQESFRKYQPKLFKLLGGIVPPDINITTVSRMKGGANNRTASIGLDWPAGKRLKVNGKLLFEARNHDIEVVAVFRSSRRPVPGKHDAELIDNYAILTFLVANGLRVPTVLAFDSTPNNSLCVPYMLLHRIPGIRLEDAYPSLTQKQKERVAMLIARELLIYDGVECPKKGILKGANYCIPASISFQENRPPTFKMTITPFTTGRRRKLPINDRGSTHLLMRGMFNNWLVLCATADDLPVDVRSIYNYCFGRLLDALDIMHERGYFDQSTSEGIALYHPDFFPRNIIIGASCRRPDNMTFEVEGVIDWDGAMALPEVLRATPPSWLWEWMDEPQVTGIPLWEEWFGDSDELPASRFSYRLNPDERKIKEKFDQSVGKERAHIMYKIEYTWIRRLWKFALYGLPFESLQEVSRFQKFMENWELFVQETAHNFESDDIKEWKPVDPEVFKTIQQYHGAAGAQSSRTPTPYPSPCIFDPE
ncbi:hypothetical protein DRE_04386 [Drechslerella stenobrocha 248]|uniref:Aminoglycoside phosphotransferase domain-containing protein n=1 Tax=Drechslerella stenobrocha 248 TaxID=1043628 RepID=W7I284_9PEZI|nr:hypothetical protein DRE_04386 [Drechslerella stenobrocha 248]